MPRRESFIRSQIGASPIGGTFISCRSRSDQSYTLQLECMWRVAIEMSTSDSIGVQVHMTSASRSTRYDRAQCTSIYKLSLL